MPIHLQCVILKVSTTLDGGWRVTLDVPESEQDTVLELAKMRNPVVRIMVEDNEDE